MLTSKGSHPELYGWQVVLRNPPQLIICEGEFDRLVLKSQGFSVVTSTSGAGTFREEWATALSSIQKIYICFDLDEAGQNGALRIGRMIPHSKIITLPEAVGKGGDVSDFFVRLERKKEDFLSLMKEAQTVPPQSPDALPVISYPPSKPKTVLKNRVQEIKDRFPIVHIARKYIRLRQSGDRFVGQCPFHNDRTPSLVIYSSSNTFHCFGCRKHGDMISFLMEIEGLGFVQALNLFDNLTCLLMIFSLLF